MKPKYAIQHEEVELTAEITKNYGEYKHYPDHRNKRGRLMDPMAELFEKRMNLALEQYHDLCRAAGHATVSSYVES